MDKYESFDEHLKERSNSWSHMLGTQSPFFKALMLPTFTYGIEIWEGDLTNSYWKVFKKSTKMHMMSHIKMRFSKFFFTTCHILFLEIGELPIELYTFKLTMGCQQHLVHLFPSWLVNNTTLLFRH